MYVQMYIAVNVINNHCVLLITDNQHSQGDQFHLDLYNVSLTPISLSIYHETINYSLFIQKESLLLLSVSRQLASCQNLNHNT